MTLQYSHSMDNVLSADVYVTDGMNNIVIIPREKSNRLALRTILRKAYPDIKFSTINGGISLNSHDALYLIKNPPEILLNWSLEAKQFIQNRAQVRGVFNEIKRTVDELKEKGKPLAEEMLNDIDFSILDNHQVVNVAAMTAPNGFGLCIFDEQGAGKTVTTIYAFDVLVERDEVDIALIIAPKSMVGEWPKDIKRFKGDLYKVTTITGSASQKRAVLSSGADIFITNYETTVNMEAELTALLRRYRGRCILVVDESFFIKNRDSKRTQSLRRLREWCGRAFVLCGTPAPNSPVDLVEQFNVVDMGITFDGLKLPEDRNEALPIVRKAINERGLYVRHLKQDVLPELPEKQFHSILVPLANEQRKIYNQVLQGYINELHSTDDESFKKNLGHFLAQRSALLQICSNPSSIKSGYNEVPAKLLVLDDILDDLIRVKGEKVVLWSYYRTSLDALVSRYKEYNPVRYDGTVSSVEERQQAVNMFQEDSSVRLFIGNAAAAGAGLTLHRARFTIYESFSDQAAHYLQSLDRTHRRGQERDVEYIILLADQTIEIKQYRTLQSKENSARDLLGDNVKEPVSRELLLSEAVGAAKLLNLDNINPS